MKQHILFALWGALFALCAALGFVPEPSAALQALMTMLSIAFFIPGFLLLRCSKVCGDLSIAILVRNLSAASLLLSAALIIANFLSALWPQLLGNILHAMLIIVSSPMICSGYWALSLFLWACLLIWAMQLLKAKKNP